MRRTTTQATFVHQIANSTDGGVVDRKLVGTCVRAKTTPPSARPGVPPTIRDNLLAIDGESAIGRGLSLKE